MEALKSEEELDLTQLEYIELDQTANALITSLQKRTEQIDNGILQHTTHTKSSLENCLIENDKALKILLRNGEELITDIIAANESRIIKRYEFEVTNNHEISEEIQNKANDCNVRLEVISERWTELKGASYHKDSVELSKSLTRQKERINGMLATKNDVIKSLRVNFDRLNNDYELNIYKQNNDAYHIIQRMNNQLDSMRNSYQRRLDLLQETVDNKRDTLNLTANRNWEQLANKTDANLRMKADLEQNKRDFFANEISRIKFDHIEATGRARINLESYQEEMELDLQKLRAKCQINSEKFDYNYQILQKKGDENVKIRMQEKRRLAQLRDTAISLRTQINDARSNLHRTAEKMDKDIVRFHGSFMELECRADMYASKNDKKFRNIWNMNKSLASSLLEKVLAIDKVLFEQQLCISWSAPDLKVYSEDELPSYQESPSIISKQLVKEVQSKSEFHSEMLANTRVMRIILRNIAEESGFIVDERLHELLAPYMQEQRTIIEIDNIFNALGIKDIHNESTLIKYFVPYAWCTICQIPEVGEKLLEDRSMGTDNELSLAENISSTIKRKSTISTEETSRKCIRHNIVIEPEKVLLALREYLGACLTKSHPSNVIGEATTMLARLSRQRYTQSRMLTSGDIVEYWNRFESIFNGERLWSSIEVGLKTYLKLLQRRDQLDTECQYLRNQNSELRHMLPS